MNSLLDRVLVKDRIESKPRLQFRLANEQLGWIVSLSKIALRANHDNGPASVSGLWLDRVLVKDRIESKPRPPAGNSALAVVGSCPCQRSH